MAGGEAAVSAVDPRLRRACAASSPELARGLARVEHLLAAISTPGCPTPGWPPCGLHAVAALWWARAGGAHPRGAVPAAAAAELTHLATLQHAGVVDRPATSARLDTAGRTGNHQRILAGDRLLAQAYLLATSAGPGVLRVLATGFAEAAEEQILRVAPACAAHGAGQVDPAPCARPGARRPPCAPLLAAAASAGAVVASRGDVARAGAWGRRLAECASLEELGASLAEPCAAAGMARPR